MNGVGESGTRATSEGRPWIGVARDVARLALREGALGSLIAKVCERLEATGEVRFAAVALTAGSLAGTVWHSGDATSETGTVQLLRAGLVPDGDGTIAAPIEQGPRRIGFVFVRGAPALAADSDAHALLAGVAADLAAAIAGPTASHTVRESGAVLASYVANAPNLVAMFDRNMVYLAASESWNQQYCGPGARSLIGRSHYDLFPDLPERWRAVHLRCLAGAVERSDDDSFIRPDGKTEYMRWEVRPWRDPAGEIGGIVMYAEATTARHEAEEALRTSERRLASALAAGGLGAWELDLDTGAAWYSDETLRIYEIPEGTPWTRADLQARRHPEDMDRVDEAVARAIRERGPFSCEFRLLFADGRVKHLVSKGEVRADAGRVRLTGFIEDVTERRRVERQLRDQAALLEETGRIAHVGGWAFDVATGSGEWTSEVARIHDLDPSVVPDVAMGLAYYHEDSRPLMERAVEEAVREGKPYDLELEIVSARGARKWVRAVGHPVAEGGKVVRVVGTLQDISERKRAAAELERVQAHLRKLSRAVEQSAAIVKITDTGGKVEYVNPRFAEVTGYRAEEAIGQLLGIAAAEPADREALALVIRSAAGGREWHGELHCRRASGEDLWLRLVVSPVRDAAGRVTHLVALEEDVTEAKRAEGALKATREQLVHAQKMEAVGRLAGGIAHDFNNLLTVIDGFSRLVLDALPPHATTSREHAQQVVRAAERAATLTRQLLTFSRRLPIRPRVVDPARVVGDMESMLRRLIGEDLDLDLDASPSGRILSDPGLLDQVVMNLVVNARDATTTGGRISISVAPVRLDAAAAGALRPHPEPGPYVRISVADTGTGMDPATQGRIFEPFFSTKEPGKGTGLGLATVYGIVQECRGAIGVESAPGRGTRFDVYLPQVADESVVPARAEFAARPAPPAAATVLLVEDDLSVREITKLVLMRAGFHVLDARLPLEALALAGSYPGPIDLLLSDVVMPQLRGPELAARARTLRPGIATVFVTGYPGDECGDLAGEVCLEKPVAPSVLLETIRETLGRRAARDAREGGGD